MRLDAIGAAVALGGVIAAWQWANHLYGDFIVPSPLASLAALRQLVAERDFLPAIGATATRAFGGAAAAALAGAVLGIAAGYWRPARALLSPLAVLLLGVPPIAWIVLAIIWFGSNGGSAALTVALATLPVAFAATVEGVATRDTRLEQMAAALGASPAYRLRTVTLPHLMSYLYPAATVIAGNAWKIAVMAELLSSTGGIGGEIAEARANFAIDRVMAWVVLVVAFTLVTELMLIAPARRRFDRWRAP